MFHFIKAIEPEKSTSLLSLHGLASEEYLIFCDAVLLDELSSSLKPIPRRMFEYYRTKLSQPYNAIGDATTSSNSEAPTAAIVGAHEMNRRVSYRRHICQDLTNKICESFQFSDIHTSEGSHRSNAMSAANTTGNAETAGVDAKLSLFFADSRLARCGSH